MDIEQILQRHVRILRSVEGLELHIAGAHPGKIDNLTERRWSFARDILLHCSQMESDVYVPMSVDLRPVAQDRARIASAEVARFVEHFSSHIDDWYEFPSEARWDEYRVAASHLAHEIRTLIDNEAQYVVPLLPLRPSERRAPPARDCYAAIAWTLRGRIYGVDRDLFV